MKFIFVYITNPTEEEAKKLARHLLKSNLIACANIFPVKSMYWWKKRINEDKEFVLIGKTIDENFEIVKKEVERLHFYTAPCIVKIPVSFNRKYSQWMESVLK